MATSKKPPNQVTFTVTAAQHGGLPGILGHFYCRSSAALQTQWFDKRNSRRCGGRDKNLCRGWKKVLWENVSRRQNVLLLQRWAELICHLSLPLCPSSTPCCSWPIYFKQSSTTLLRALFLFFTLIQWLTPQWLVWFGLKTVQCVEHHWGGWAGLQRTFFTVMLKCVNFTQTCVYFPGLVPMRYFVSSFKKKKK